MKTTILLLMAAALTMTAAEPNKPKTGAAPKPNPPVIADGVGVTVAKVQNFTANEFGVDIYGVMSRENLTTGSPRWGTGWGVSYFPFRGLGFRVAGVALEDFSGPAFDEGSAEIIFRAPLWDRIAPFGYVAGIHSFERDDWGAGAGGGLEFRLTKAIAIFGRTGLHVTTDGRNDWQTSAGVGYRF